MYFPAVLGFCCCIINCYKFSDFNTYFFIILLVDQESGSLADPLLGVLQAAVSSEGQAFLPSSQVLGLRPSSPRSHQVPFRVALSIGSLLRSSSFLQGQQASLPCVSWQESAHLYYPQGRTHHLCHVV